jgi:hypothetical protein
MPERGHPVRMSAKRELSPAIRIALSLLRKLCGQDVRAPLSIPARVMPIAFAELFIRPIVFQELNTRLAVDLFF